MNTNALDFTNSSLFTFDSGVIEITGGVGKLKNLWGDTSQMGAVLSIDGNLSKYSTNKVGTLVGGAAIADSCLDLTGDTIKYAMWDGANANIGSVGTIRFEMKFPADFTNGTGLFEFVKRSTTANSISFHLDGAHNIYGGIADYLGTVIWGDAIGSWWPADENWHVFEFSWDGVTGFMMMFIDGVIIGGGAFSTFELNNDVSDIAVGIEASLTATANMKVRKLQVFSSVLHYDAHPTDYQYTMTDTPYSITNPTITPIASFISSLIKDFRTTETLTGNDKLKYTLLAGSQDRYVTGGIAENSNGTYSEASSKAEILEDLEHLIAIENDVDCKLKIFLHSDDGNTTPEISVAELDYLEILALPALSTRVQIEGYIELAGNPAVDLPIYVRPFEAGFWNNGGFHEYAWEKVGVCHSNGYMFGFVYLQPTDKFWEMKIGTERYKFTVLDQEQMDISLAPVWEKIVEV